MNITPEQVKEIQALYYDVAMDSSETETRDFLMSLETDDLNKAYEVFKKLIKNVEEKTDKRFANTISDAGTAIAACAEALGFVKGFLYARALLIG